MAESEKKDGIADENTEPTVPPTGSNTPQEPETPGGTGPKYIYQTIDNFYNRVRGALGVCISLTDDTIDLYENAPLAELKIVQKVPNFCCLDDIKYALFESCIVYMTCYALCPTAGQMKIKRQKDPSLELEFADYKDTGGRNRFLELIDDIISTQINGEERGMFVGFRVTPPSPPIGYCCRRHWLPPLYKHIVDKPQNGGSGDNTEGNQPTDCECEYNPYGDKTPDTGNTGNTNQTEEAGG